MEGEKETLVYNASHNEEGKQKEIEKEELLSEKALEDNFELEEELDKLPI